MVSHVSRSHGIAHVEQYLYFGSRYNLFHRRVVFVLLSECGTMMQPQKLSGRNGDKASPMLAENNASLTRYGVGIISS